MNDIVKYEGGGVRESAMGKGTYKYISAVAMKRLSHRYQYGEMKYGASDNYKKGLPLSNCWDSAMRHMIAYLDGDNSEDHLAAVAWNVFAMMEMEVNNQEYVDIGSRLAAVKAQECTPEYYRDLAMQAFSEGGSMK